MTRVDSAQRGEYPHFFIATPNGTGFEVRDSLIAGRVYQVPLRGEPTLAGRPVTNELALKRIRAAVEDWVDRALLDEATAEAEAA